MIEAAEAENKMCSKTIRRKNESVGLRKRVKQLDEKNMKKYIADTVLESFYFWLL